MFQDWEFGDWSFGNYQFDGDYNFAGAYNFGDYTFEPVTDTEWGEWDTLPGENPDDCLRSQNADHITQINNVVTPGAITDGVITDGGIEDGTIEDGTITEGDITEASITSGAITSGTVTANGTARCSSTERLCEPGRLIHPATPPTQPHEAPARKGRGLTSSCAVRAARYLPG
jgi:hypothetical protein